MESIITPIENSQSLRTGLKEVALKGFFLIIHCPSEEVLQVTIDASELHPTYFISLIHELQDTLRDIDEQYAIRKGAMKGRSLISKHWRSFVIDERKRIIRFAPFPESYLNKMRTLRRELYERVNKYAVVIFSDGVRKNYLLPDNLAPQFVDSINNLNDEINKLNQMIDNFTKTLDYDNILFVLHKYNLQEPTKTFRIPEIRVDLIPVGLSRADLEKWISESPELHRILEETKERHVRHLLEDLKERLEPLINELLKQENLKRIRENLVRMDNILTSLGLESISRTVITPLINATNTINFNTTTTKAEVERIKSLLEGMVRGNDERVNKD